MVSIVIIAIATFRGVIERKEQTLFFKIKNLYLFDFIDNLKNLQYIKKTNLRKFIFKNPL